MTIEDMPQMRRATRSSMVTERTPVASPSVTGPADSPHRHAVSGATMAVAFAVLLLVLATTSQGAFAISRWAPLTLFLLALLLGSLLVPRGIALPASIPVRVMLASIPVRVMLASVWALAGWSIVSMLWAKSPGSAFEGGDRMVLYAAIITLPFALPSSRSALAAVGWSVTAGICATALYVLIRLL